jgi:hypothetical protein
MNYPAAELRGINSSHKELFEAELRGIDPHEIKSAMKSKVQKAEPIYNDLSARFPAKPRKGV